MSDDRIVRRGGGWTSGLPTKPEAPRNGVAYGGGAVPSMANGPGDGMSPLTAGPTAPGQAPPWGPAGAPEPTARAEPPASLPLGVPAHAETEIGREVLFRPTRRPPSTGWRRVLHRVSAGTVNPGESTADVRRRELVGRVNQAIRGDYKIAVLSLNPDPPLFVVALVSRGC